MAVALAQFKSAYVASSPNCTLTMNSAPTNGNTLVAIAGNPNATPTANTGWTLRTSHSENYLDVAIATKVAGASETTSQTPFTGSGNNHWKCGIWEYSGLGASPIFNDGSSTTESTAASPPTVSFTVTPGNSGDIVCMAAFVNETATGTPTISGMSVDDTSTATIGSVMGHVIGAPGGSQTYTATFGSGTASHAADAAILFIFPGGNLYTQSLTAGFTPSAAFTKLSEWLLTAGFTPTGAFVKRLARAFSAGFSPTGAFVKTKFQVFTGGFAPTAAFVKQKLQSLTAGFTPTGAFVKSKRQALTAGFTPTETQTKTTGVVQTASETFSGSFVKSAHRAFTASVAPTAQFVKSTWRAFTASLTPTGSFAKTTLRAFTANFSPDGAFSKATIKALSAAATFAGDLGTSYIRGVQTFYQTFTAGVSFTGAQNRFASLLLVAQASFIGSQIKNVARNLAGSIGPSGSESKQVDKAFVADVGFVAGIGKAIARSFTAVASFVANFVSNLKSGSRGSVFLITPIRTTATFNPCVTSQALFTSPVRTTLFREVSVPSVAFFETPIRTVAFLQEGP